MMKIIQAASAALVYVGLTFSASAAVLHVESLNGDLGGSLSPTDFGTLGPGSYSVVGQASIYSKFKDLSYSGLKETDYFHFSLAKDTRLESFMFQELNVTDGMSLDTTIRYWGEPTNTSYYWDGLYVQNYEGQNLLTNNLPDIFIGEGMINDIYIGLETVLTELHTGTYEGTAYYSLSFDIGSPQISAVPLPAAAPLYGAGLAVLGFLGWRKRRKAA